MISRLTILFQGAKYILQTEGLRSLIGKVFSFLKVRFLQYGTCYLYHEALEEKNEADFLPKIQNYSLKIVCNNQQADELAANGLEFRSPGIIDRDRLDKGAIASCIFVGAELAHKSWHAVTEEAKTSMTTLPYEVGFSKNHAFAGPAFTNPKFRGLGLWSYRRFKTSELLRKRGFVAMRWVVAESNIEMQRRLANKIGTKPYAEARYLRILCWKYWKEKPFT